MTSVSKKRIEWLVNQWLDQQIDAPGIEELNFLLRDDAEARSHYLAMMDLHCGMAGMATDHPFDPSSVSVMALPSPSSLPAIRLPWIIAFVSLAATLLMTAALYRSSVDPKILSVSEVASDGRVLEVDSQKIVRIHDSASAEFFDGSPIWTGQTMMTGQEYVLTGGSLSLAFPQGAEVILESPSVFEIIAEDHLLVSLGRCSVHAPDGAEGFRVDTPRTHVVDLGTRFSVDVDDVGQTEVQVIEGAAKVRPVTNMNDADFATLTDGQAVRFSGEQGHVSEDIQFESSHYRSALPDRVMNYQCVEPDEPVETLRTIHVQRGGREQSYSMDELIRVQVVHFIAGEQTRNVATSPDLEAPIRSFLESDHLLTTGLINASGSVTPLLQDPLLVSSNAGGSTLAATPGMGIKFVTPVMNGPGPDVVFFDLQSRVDPPVGDGFHVSPLRFRPGLKTHSVSRFDITMRSAEALKVKKFRLPVFAEIDHILSYNTADAIDSSFPALDFFVLATGIDLSDLGYAPGEPVDGLFIQDDAKDVHRIDPVFIAGLPSSSELSP